MFVFGIGAITTDFGPTVHGWWQRTKGGKLHSSASFRGLSKKKRIAGCNTSRASERSDFSSKRTPEATCANCAQQAYIIGDTHM